MDRKEIGRRIEKLRKERNMSQYQLAMDAGISTSYIPDLEKGIKLDPVLPHEKIKMMLMHLKELQKEKDERTAVLEMRTHFLHYLNGLPENKKIKNTLCQAKSTQEIETILRNYDRMISS